MIICALVLMAAAPAHAAAPDLIVKSVIVTTANVAPGGSVRVESTVKNTGTAPAGKSTVRFYLSKNGVKNAEDVCLKTWWAVPALGRGKASKAAIFLKVPAACEPGSYYVIAAVDDLKKVRESREKNNTRKTVNQTSVVIPGAPDGFVLIPAGSFQMGQDNIGIPVHRVYVSAFYMAKTEVTKELWDEVRAWALNNGYTGLVEWNSGFASKGANHPVHSFAWCEVVLWCNARSEMDNLTPCYTVYGSTYKSTDDNFYAMVCDWAANGYRLPTEAEWEKAARGGLSGKLFPWGNTITHSQANYNSSSHYAYDVSPTRGFHPIWSNNHDGNYTYTSPVGSFAPNGYGLYDMAGNVSEWCWDWDGIYAAGSKTDPRGPASGKQRLHRGGSWGKDAYYCRVDIRHREIPDYGDLDLGFRIARSFVP
jgi:formylglycine-generating enzyme required for sulfatase activity